MAYYTFLKSLRSLEEFRKNPHIKIPPKSPPTNFQSLGIFKIHIFISKQFFLQVSSQSAQRPADPFSLLAHPAQPAFIFLLPHQNRARKLPAPAGLASPQWSAPTTSTDGKKLPRHPSFISPLNGAPSPLQSLVTSTFNLRVMKLLQCCPLKAPDLPCFASTL
jgi:hypothetical protein